MTIAGIKVTELMLRILLIVAVTALLIALVHFFAARARRFLFKLDQVPDERRQQWMTLLGVARWALDIVFVGGAVLMVLNTLGINTAPLLASAGVAGLAVSLGAQTLIKDVLGGLLILAENQYSVGDSIQVGLVSGDVERITLRATYLRSLSGDLVVVPNGDVRTVANQTRGWSRAIVEVGIAYEEDLDRALAVLGTAAAAFASLAEYAPKLLEPPEVQGAVSLGDAAITVRLLVKTRPGKQAEIGRALRQALLAACDREGVRLAYPLRQVWAKG